MRQNFILSALSLISLIAYTQPSTEIYVFDLNLDGNKVVLSNPKNISNNDGYDNQPSFLNDNAVLFASTRSEQTDIRLFNIEAGSINSWITDTPTGSEYSPLKIPNKAAVSAIRLDLDGLQRLYEYELKNGKSKPILKDLKVGYHIWYNDYILVSTVLIENRMDLVVSNLKDKSNYTFQKNVGRNLSKIPNTDLISFISKEGDIWEIKSLNPISGETNSIAKTLKNSEDICWLNDKSILTGNGKSLFRLNTKSDGQWKKIQSFKEDEINNITRIAVRDIDAFMETYTNDITLINFPNKELLKGQKKMRESYASYFDTTPDLNCKIINRIVIGNKVIDEEYITANGQNFNAVAIYEVENGKIAKVTFVQ